MRRRVAMVVVLAVSMSPASGDVLPRLPFHGAYGGTLGAGSLTGWERHGGDNPAVLPAASGWSGASASPGTGMSAAVAGYVPFGLEELRVAEVMAARDGDAFGVALRWTALRDLGTPAGVDDARTPGRSAGRLRGQAAWRPFPARALSVGSHVDLAGGAPEAGLGLLWRPFPSFGLGTTAEAGAWPTGGRARTVALRLGADAGLAFGGKGGARIAVERHVEGTGGAVYASWRVGGMLRPHPLLAVTAGWLPGTGQMALGVRFGAGPLALASALRRHVLLGGTSVQSLEWNARANP